MRAVRERPLLVAAVTLAVILGAGAWLLVRSPQHRATAQVQVTPTPYYDPTYLGLPGVVRDTPGDPSRAVQTAATILDSPAAAAAAAQRLGAGWNQTRVRAAVTVVPVGGTNIVAVQAEAADATTANRLANAFVGAALREHRLVLRTQALGLIGVLRETLRTTNPRVTRLRVVSGGIDPTFSRLHGAVGAGSIAGPGSRQVLTLAVFAGVILGIGTALLAEGITERRRTTRAPPQGRELGGPVPVDDELAEQRLRSGDQAQP